ncbi:MAG: hypothetical protein AVDCRST_MAG64-3245, partial [uncultured Phycisphaerae bacterium]
GRVRVVAGPGAAAGRRRGGRDDLARAPVGTGRVVAGRRPAGGGGRPPPRPFAGRPRL